MLVIKSKYFLYGSIVSTLLFFVATYANSDGVFGDYFDRMTGYCLLGGSTSEVLTGLGNVSDGVPFGTKRCTSLKAIIGNIFGSVVAPEGQAIIGFKNDGTPKYGDVNWHNVGPNIGYTGGNVGIGTNSPNTKLEVNGAIRATEGMDVSNAGGAYTYVILRDDESMNGIKYIHSNSNLIGFLGGDGSWLEYVNQFGQVWTASYGWLHDKFLSKNGDTLNEVYNNGWYRSKGTTGWYSQDFGGGWYMTDGTWIRSYGSKYLYVDSVIQAGAYVNSPAYYYISDARLKKNLAKIDSALEKIEKLNGYYFTWKKNNNKDIGLIAQEVEKVFPDLVSSYIDPDTKQTFKNVEYGHMIAPIIEAIKELAKNKEQQKNEIQDLKNEIQDLKNEIQDLKNEIQDLKK